MSTPNFKRLVTVSKYYLLEEPEDGYESIEYDCIVENIEEELSTIGMRTPRVDRLNSYTYEGYTPLSEYTMEVFNKDIKEWTAITIYAVLASGYYSGASLDVLIDANGIVMLDELASFVSQTTMDKVLRFIKRIERVYGSIAIPAECVAIFSNGEAIYHKTI